jgi:hypothetical protein
MIEGLRKQPLVFLRAYQRLPFQGLSC